MEFGITLAMIGLACIMFVFVLFCVAFINYAANAMSEETRDFSPEELAGIKREQEIYHKRFSQQEIDQAVERTLKQ